MKDWKKAQWIWRDNSNTPDEFVKFWDKWEYRGGTAVIDISCDSNYTLYVNGELAAFGQYPDYPHYKVYDSVDITKYLVEGSNELVAVVWYYGNNSQTYYKGNAGLIYEVICGGEAAAYSGAHTLCRLCSDYVSHAGKLITVQLGYSYHCDLTGRVSGADFETEGAANAVIADGITYERNLRPIKHLELEPLQKGVLIDEAKRLYDIGEETAGFLHIELSGGKGDVTVAYGEHISDGEVRQIIGRRDFSVGLTTDGERREFTDTFRRLGCRYLQVQCAADTVIHSIGIRKTSYPVNRKSFNAGNVLRRRIYDTAVRTLELCMHEHYEDTPWREQALYNMDSRNQMLFGYYAFADNNHYARANLVLMSKGQRADRLMPLCFPAGLDFPIPYFSLMYVVQVAEYIEYTGDVSVLEDCLKPVQEIMDVFLSRREDNGLVAKLDGYWNFYEWSDGLSGDIGSKEPKDYDLPLNCFLLMALDCYRKICLAAGLALGHDEVVTDMRRAIFDNFYDAKRGLFKTFCLADPHYAVLSNALAVLSGAGGDKAKEVCASIITEYGSLVDITLSMKSFLYDALISCDGSYAAWVLDDIDKTYSYMLKRGATSFWETVKGEEDFDGAGSLCHGWSALPVYYYHVLDK